MTWFDRIAITRPWVTSAWAQAWFDFVYFGTGHIYTTAGARIDFGTRARYERAECARRAREHD